MATEQSAYIVRTTQWDSLVRNTLSSNYLANSDDMLWAIDTKRKLIFANDAYVDFIYRATGVSIHIDDSPHMSDGNKAMDDKWDYFYTRALKGEQFHIITNFASQQASKLVDANFIPLVSGHQVLGTVCLARSTSSMTLPSILAPTDEEESAFHSRS